MLLGARQFFEKRGAPTPPLPYDAEVEYIESTGTQYIDTGVIADQDVLLVCSGKWTDTTTTTVKYAVTTPIKSRVVFGWLLNRRGTSFGFGAVTNSMTAGFVDTDWHSVVLCSTGDEPYYEVDGTKTLLAVQTSTTSLGKIFLFGNGDTTNGSIFRLSFVMITSPSTGEVLIDLIPVRFTNELGQSEGAMYDRANPTVGMNPDGSPRTDGLYRNRGTGAFLYGHDKS